MSEPTSDPPAPSPPPPAGVRTMAVVRWVLVAVTALVAVGSILAYANARRDDPSRAAEQLYYCPMHPSVVQDHPGECPICSMTLVPKPISKVNAASAAVGKYRCPMHPHRTSDDPNARCPDCGMKLEPWPDGGAASAGVAGLSSVELSTERIQLVGMRTASVKREALAGELRTVGVVMPSERGLAQVTTRFGGWIEKVAAVETGQRVRRGQVLATIYSPDVLKAEQELLVARGWSAGSARSGEPDAFTRSLGDDARRRLELLGVGAQEIEELLRAGKPSAAIPVRAPIGGYIVGKAAVAGLAVQPGTPLYEIADLGRVWVTADVYELDVARVRLGQPARFELASFPGEMHTGKVEHIHPVLDPQSRTLRVRLELRNRFDASGPRLRPGMYGTAHLDLPPTAGLLIPAEAVVDTGELQYVFVAKPHGRFEPRRVKLGARAHDRIAVTSGLAEGEVVVTTGNFLIDSESRLRAAIEGQAAPPPAASGDAGKR